MTDDHARHSLEYELLLLMRSDMAALKADLKELNRVFQRSVTDIALLKFKMGMIAAFAGVASSVFVQWLGKVFF